MNRDPTKHYTISIKDPWEIIEKDETIYYVYYVVGGLPFQTEHYKLDYALQEIELLKKDKQADKIELRKVTTFKLKN